jgi:hypothetical protein
LSVGYAGVVEGAGVVAGVAGVAAGVAGVVGVVGVVGLPTGAVVPLDFGFIGFNTVPAFLLATGAFVGSIDIFLLVVSFFSSIMVLTLSLVSVFM